MDGSMSQLTDEQVKELVEKTGVDEETIRYAHVLLQMMPTETKLTMMAEVLTEQHGKVGIVFRFADGYEVSYPGYVIGDEYAEYAAMHQLLVKSVKQGRIHEWGIGRVEE